GEISRTMLRHKTLARRRRLLAAFGFCAAVLIGSSSTVVAQGLYGAPGSTGTLPQPVPKLAREGTVRGSTATPTKLACETEYTDTFIAQQPGARCEGYDFTYLYVQVHMLA